MRSFLGLILLVALSGCAAHTLIDVGSKRDKEKGVVSTTCPSVLHIKQGQHSFDMLAGPVPSKDPRRPGVAKLQIRSSAVAFNLLEGWLYLYGQYPFGSTDIVDAGATGTTMAIEWGANQQRVYLLKQDGKESVNVSLKPGVSSPANSPRSRKLTTQSYLVIRQVSPNVWQIDWPAKKIKGDADVAATVHAMHQGVLNTGLGGWPDDLDQSR